jgi:hypothetical protein
VRLVDLCTAGRRLRKRRGGDGKREEGEKEGERLKGEWDTNFTATNKKRPKTKKKNSLSLLLLHTIINGASGGGGGGGGLSNGSYRTEPALSSLAIRGTVTDEYGEWNTRAGSIVPRRRGNSIVSPLL